MRLCFVLLGLAGGVGVLRLRRGLAALRAGGGRPRRRAARALGGGGVLTAAALIVLRALGIWPGTR